MRTSSIATFVLAAALFGAPGLASAQPSDDPHHPGTAPEEEQQATSPPAGMMGEQMMGMMPQGMMPQGMMPQGMMPQGMMDGMGAGMMACPMMAAMAGMHQSMMAMMQQAMGAAMPAMQGPGSTDMGRSAMGDGLGVVTPSQHLSVEDVRHHFEHRLETQGNSQLGIGDVSESDDGTIVAEIVTVDGSLVDRFSIDRHTGVVQRAE